MIRFKKSMKLLVTIFTLMFCLSGAVYATDYNSLNIEKFNFNENYSNQYIEDSQIAPRTGLHSFMAQVYYTKATLVETHFVHAGPDPLDKVVVYIEYWDPSLKKIVTSKQRSTKQLGSQIDFIESFNIPKNHGTVTAYWLITEDGKTNTTSDVAGE